MTSVIDIPAPSLNSHNPALAARQRQNCPPWCETSDHGQGELTHRSNVCVSLSLHRLPEREAVTLPREWQNEVMNLSIEQSPVDAEPHIEVTGHTECGDFLPHQETRLSLAEAELLARALLDLVAQGRGA